MWLVWRRAVFGVCLNAHPWFAYCSPRAPASPGRSGPSLQPAQVTIRAASGYVSPDSTHSQDIVTAVIVAHDGAAWLPRVAQAVANQTRPVQRVVAVDTGSRDRSGAMLAQAFGRAAVFGMERATGYGVAVAKALRHRAANTSIPPAGGSRDERTEWVWLLHDDCEPAPDALERLLAGAREAPAAAVLGPKVRDWSDRDVLLEAGLTIDRAGRRVTGIEPREADQGQHDGDRDVLAVSSAGMLARRDVWDEVGGFDPGMRLFREDTDFCWRVQAAGLPGAGDHQRRRLPRRGHREEPAPGRRGAASPAPGPAQRTAGPRGQPARPAHGLRAGGQPGAVHPAHGLLPARQAPERGPGRTRRLRLGGRAPAPAAARSAATGPRAARPPTAAWPSDIPPGRSFRMLAEYAINTLSKSQRAEAVGSHHATDDPSDDDSLLVDTGLVQRLLTNPGVLLFLTLTVVALVAERSLLRQHASGRRRARTRVGRRFRPVAGVPAGVPPDEHRDRREHPALRGGHRDPGDPAGRASRGWRWT